MSFSVEVFEFQRGVPATLGPQPKQQPPAATELPTISHSGQSACTAGSQLMCKESFQVWAGIARIMPLLLCHLDVVCISVSLFISNNDGPTGASKNLALQPWSLYELADLVW